MSKIAISNNNLPEIIAYLENRDVSQLKPLKLAFLRNITLEPIQPYLSFGFGQLGYNVNYYFSLYDNALQLTNDENSDIYQFFPEITIIAMDLQTLCPDLWWRFCELDQKDIIKNSNYIINYISQIIISIRSVDKKMIILLHNFPVPTHPSYGIYDSQSSFGQVKTIRKLNTELSDLIQQWSDVYLIDLDLIQSKLGAENLYDLRYWHIGRAPYTKELYIALVDEYKKCLRSLKGKTKKCLALDLDNTLWGGILGEDGLQGIQLGHTYPGSAYCDLQRVVLNLYHRGVILAICSKNNHNDVIEALNHHPDMILHEKHFSIIKANWNNKADNLLAISEELNIGLDSIVFIDDSDFEINLIKKILPEVSTYQLTGDPAYFAALLSQITVFDSLSSTTEDKNRSKMYHSQSKRKETKSQFSDLTAYYRSLEIKVTIKLADEFSITRITQLIQRSNQFNLTTKRFTESELKIKMSSNESDVFYLEMTDRFGRHGIVGTAIIDYFEKEAVIISFLVSCRVIGYGVAVVLLNTILLASRAKGMKSVIGKYIKSSKNQLVENFYPENDFIPVDAIEIDTKQFKYELFKNYDKVPDYYSYINYPELEDGRETKTSVEPDFLSSNRRD